MSHMQRQSEIRNLRSHEEWSPRTSLRQADRRSNSRASRLEKPDLTVPILFFGVAAELIVPWLVIWLSDLLVFDVPMWATWLAFGGPLALGLLVLAIYRVFRAWPAQPAFARARHGH